MTIRLKLKDGTSGKIIEMKLNPEITVGELIIHAADCLNKKSGAYQLKYKNKILLSDNNLSDSGLKTGSILELLMDPEGG